MRGSLERARSELAERLRERRGEIEEALLTRTYAIADPKEAADPEYAQGLRAAVSAALDFGLAAVEHGEERSPQVPVLLLAQARLAARNNIPLDTVLRRYFAGYTLLGDFLMQEAESERLLGSQELKHLFRTLSSLFDHLIAAVTEEYARDGEARIASTDERRAERIERLLVGHLLDVSEFGYDFNGWSLGAIASGPSSQGAFRELARAQDCRLLSIRRKDDLAWAWLGSRRPRDPAELVHIVSSLDSRPTAVAFGEPAEGLVGWRLTHRQAAAAFPVALRLQHRLVRYGEVALLASALQDDLLATSLRQLYLDPLASERDGGATFWTTLRAYFASERNLSSTAAALEVNRHTVANRIRVIEEKLQRPIHACSTELETAIRLAELEVPTRYENSDFDRVR